MVTSGGRRAARERGRAATGAPGGTNIIIVIVIVNVNVNVNANAAIIIIISSSSSIRCHLGSSHFGK